MGITIVIIITYICAKLLISKFNIENNIIAKDFINRFIYMGVNSIFTLYSAISIFYYFLNIKIKNKFINYIASCSLAVYLIQEQPKFRNILWKNIFNINLINKNSVYELMSSNTNVVNKLCAILCSFISMNINVNASRFFIIYAVMCTICIFIISVLIESIRKMTFERILKKILDLKLIEKRLEKIDKWMNVSNEFIS